LAFCADLLALSHLVLSSVPATLTHYVTQHNNA